MVEVDSVHGLNSNANKLFRQLSDLRVFPDNLPVEIRASLSALAAKNNEKRLVRFFAKLLRGSIVILPFNRARNFLHRRLFNSLAIAGWS